MLSLFLVVIYCSGNQYRISTKKMIEQRLVLSTPLVSRLLIKSVLSGKHTLVLQFPQQVVPDLLSLRDEGIEYTFINRLNVLCIRCSGPVALTVPIFKMMLRVFEHHANIDRGLRLPSPAAIRKADDGGNVYDVYVGNVCVDVVPLPNFSFPFKAYNLCGVALFFVINLCVTALCD